MANSGAATLEQAQNKLNQLIDNNEVQYNRGLIGVVDNYYITFLKDTINIYKILIN